ncbi:MerR family transcriptional regulator [Actinophytocola sp.]|uniref:MerR family transcriptional regulator n=1 Tax=Actinophytocola sp. TaxID=1872138 RepID=UPI0038998E70
MNEHWTIGDLAKASGVTIRTLYYYDEIGLVSASDRTASGHRRYTGDDVRRLYRVRALTQLGLSLDEVGRVLARGAEDLAALRDLLQAQLADLEVRARQLAEVRARVRGLVDQLAGETMPAPARFLSTLELTGQLYGQLSAEQRDALAERRAELGADTVDALRSEWVEVVRELKRHVVTGTPPADPAVRELAARWERVTGAFRTGRPHVDEQIGATSGVAWQEHGTRIDEYLSDRVDWLEPGDMVAIVDLVRQARS